MPGMTVAALRRRVKARAPHDVRRVHTQAATLSRISPTAGRGKGFQLWRENVRAAEFADGDDRRSGSGIIGDALELK